MRSKVLSILKYYSRTNNRSNLYKITDRFVDSLYYRYESYSLLGGLDYVKLTNNRKFQVIPIGRLINVKIMEEVDNDSYKDLCDDLKSYYKKDKRVNDVFINKAGTINIDCRKLK